MKKSVKKSNVVAKKKLISSKLQKRVRSGIKNFDKLIEGGYEKNSVNFIAGGSGSGKSIFATQFLIEGIESGEKCLFVSFEEKKEDFYGNMLRLGWDLAKYESQGKFFFLEYSPQKVKTMLEEGGGAIEALVLSNKITRISIDSITGFALLFQEESERRTAAVNLFNMLRKWGCTSLLTFEKDPLTDKGNASKTLEFETDSIICLYFAREKQERERYLEIIKMRGTDHSREIFPYDIKKGGVIVGSKPFKGKLFASKSDQ